MSQRIDVIFLPTASNDPKAIYRGFGYPSSEHTFFFDSIPEPGG